MDVLNWENVRPKADVAIRAGMKTKDFLDEMGITRSEWTKIKPADFHWRKIQCSLGIKVSRGKPTDKKETEEKTTYYQCKIQSCQNEIQTDVVCPYCRLQVLESVINLYKQGFTTEDITKVLE
jgi:hypothetical protein